MILTLRHRRLIGLMGALLALVPLLMPSADSAAADPTLTLTPGNISCTTPLTAHGENFPAGSEVIISAGGVDDIPTSVYQSYLGPYPVDEAGSFTVEIPAGFGIYECFGGPLGRDGAPYEFTASTVLDFGSDEQPFGLPAATATFTFAIDPDDPRLTLTPDHGAGCLDVVAKGENFTPGTYITLISGGLGGHVFGEINEGEILVDATGSFTVTLSKRLTPFITCGDDALPQDGSRYIVSASTGRTRIDEDPNGPRAADVFTVTLLPADRFEQTWAHADLAVAVEHIARTWIWGPEPLTDVFDEPYAESLGGKRNVQYYDKSRMEISHPDADRTNSWYVTNGLLVVEMVEGHYQSGDDTFDESPEPAEIPIAGDTEANGITYSDIDAHGLRDADPPAEGATITQMIDPDGEITNQPRLGEHGVTAAVLAPETGHRVASVFWAFMNSETVVYVSEQYSYTAPLFENPYYATGLPITEAYWSRIVVGGVEQDVLWQCFERRCLTYTPGNPDGWQIESGNVGLHYYHWRYPQQ